MELSYTFLQNYWWILISTLGAFLVFLMFVQGGGAMIFSLGKTEEQRGLIINSAGRKWEFTFTTLVVFGGAFFASFPLFYSTSFGGAYWVWMLILLMFVLQAVSYEFQHRATNPATQRLFRIFLVANGWLAPFLIGAAVSTFFTGSAFHIDKGAMGSIDALGASLQISVWDSPLHGLEALGDWRNWAFGLMLVALSQTSALLYMLNNIKDEELNTRIVKRLRITAPVFVVLFLVTAGSILLGEGFGVMEDGTVQMVDMKYLMNLVEMPVVLIMLLLGVVLVLMGAIMGMVKGRRCSVWPYGIGVIVVVMALFFIAGFNNTAYYPSYTDLSSSLTLTNSCSSPFTLKVMFYVSLILPIVIAYMFYAWRQIDKKPITQEELSATDGKY